VLNAGIKLPEVASTSWIAPSAQVVGEVKVGDNCSIWYNCTVRGEQRAAGAARARAGPE
jgi:carbonic anhydrase/acetyltransferase-like protein (isoleucine patch superfamily)